MYVVLVHENGITGGADGTQPCDLSPERALLERLARLNNRSLSRQLGENPAVKVPVNGLIAGMDDEPEAPRCAVPGSVFHKPLQDYVGGDMDATDVDGGSTPEFRLTAGGGGCACRSAGASASSTAAITKRFWWSRSTRNILRPRSFLNIRI